MRWNPTTWGFRHPLAVWVVWQPANPRVDEHTPETDPVWGLAEALRRKLGGEWYSEGDRADRAGAPLDGLPAVEAEIPVFFYRTTEPDALKLEQAVVSHPADRVVVLLVLDGQLKKHAEAWRAAVEWLNAEHETDHDANTRRGGQPGSGGWAGPFGRPSRAFSLLPVATADGDHDVFGFASKLIPLRWVGTEDLPKLYTNLVRHLCEQLEEGELPRVFVSYTRADAKRIADEVFDELQHTPGLVPWRDEEDINPGHNFRERIEAGLPHSFYLAILSPGFVRGRWTLREAGLARAHDRPTAVLDVLEGPLRRLPPELGNAPMLRWPRRRTPGRRWILGALVLAEILRHRTHAARVRMLAAATRHGQALDGCVLPPGRHGAVAPGAVRIYADPPLLEEELRHQTRGSAGRYLTATQFAADAGWPGWAGRPYSLRVGLSASAPDDAPAQGLYEPQMNDLSVCLARTLMCLGLRLVYGGDLRPGGLTRHLLRVAKQYAPHQESSDSLRAFMSWPFWLDLKAAEVQALERAVGLVTTAAPPVVGALPESFELGRYLQSTDGRLAASMALLDMRRQLVGASDARLAVGGRSAGAVGRLPGVVEEVWLSLRAGQPVYLAAGLGGATRQVYECIVGDNAEALTLEAQESGHPRYREVYDKLPASAAVRFDELRAELQGIGLAGLSRLNGLSEHENGALAKARTATEIIYWVSRGLGRVFGGPDAVLRLRQRIDHLEAGRSVGHSGGDL